MNNTELMQAAREPKIDGMAEIVAERVDELAKDLFTDEEQDRIARIKARKAHFKPF